MVAQGFLHLRQVHLVYGRLDVGHHDTAHLAQMRAELHGSMADTKSHDGDDAHQQTIENPASPAGALPQYTV